MSFFYCDINSFTNDLHNCSWYDWYSIRHLRLNETQISRLSWPCNANSESKKQSYILQRYILHSKVKLQHPHISLSCIHAFNTSPWICMKWGVECAYDHTINKHTQYMRRADDQSLLITRHSAIRWTQTRQYSDSFSKMIISNWLKLEW